ncbi:hypothetical protein CK203_072744 [Vitis vinifera]|uniref:Uncharacterized protein n=1 Tax=Vitis vinifera TaxID=29760 RepID=A0A438EZ56_VITVI|nr:hypothetical protein CK203_072744 [Vitis vinifera]
MAVKYGSSPFSCVSTSLSSPFHSKRIFQLYYVVFSSLGILSRL